MLMPFTTAERRVLGTKFVGTVDMIFASASSQDVVDQAETEITDLLRERHRIAPRAGRRLHGAQPRPTSPRRRESPSQVMTKLLLSVASISLLVGGIGIMNILLVSVTERTREIGIRMAVGAKSRHILLQFLVEAITLSMVGGLAGAALGIAGAEAISFFADWPTLLSAPAVARFDPLLGRRRRLLRVLPGAQGLAPRSDPRRCATSDPMRARARTNARGGPLWSSASSSPPRSTTGSS